MKIFSRKDAKAQSEENKMNGEMENEFRARQFGVVMSALRLEEWLSVHVGHTDDWPVRIMVDNVEDANRLAGLLSGLARAVAEVKKGPCGKLLVVFMEE